MPLPSRPVSLMNRTPRAGAATRTSCRVHVENPGPAPSPGCIRPSRAGVTQGEHHGQVPVAQALPRRAGSRSTTSRWTSGQPDEVEAHIQFMNDFAARLESSGEFIDGQALSPDGMWVRYDGEGRPPVTDGPFAETKDLIAGWMVIDVDSYERAIELAGELSAAPGAGGEPIHEWLEVRPFLTAPPTVTSHRTDRGRRRAARARPAGPERPRPSRCRLRDGRGRRAGGAHPGARRRGRTSCPPTRRDGSSRSRGERSST